MFTGLVQGVGVVESVEPTPAGARVRVGFGSWSHRPATGDSISVSGCCLTVRERCAEGVYGFDAVPETLSRTTIGSLRAGDRVNLEHAATASTYLGGHIVQGHVDVVGVVDRVETDAGWRVWFGVAADAGPLLVPKGSVTVDGVSLTIASAGGSAVGAGFSVALIPETLERTTLGALMPRDRVNIETDVLVRSVREVVGHLLRADPALLGGGRVAGGA